MRAPLLKALAPLVPSLGLGAGGAAALAAARVAHARAQPRGD